MRRAILVLNAGSSSIKFLLFTEEQGQLEPAIRGQIEGLHTAPHSSLAMPQAN
jgi:acetate kinase